ncbi:uncharacterized protein LOC133293886 [Gastrolobium bilobum]|uniref:uncharacterized protein LOC133293886 n=1 Tax=Gastrolobium bilobum TaxID=150636 RepID=UPI002AB177AF|nr:uncharacterized protein LOC133293886 [Gastrolobium bilobum]
MAIDFSRITLRPFKLSDVDDFMLLAGDDRVTYYTRWNTFASREQALTFIQDVCIPHPWSRFTCIDDRIIGFISVSTGSGDERCRAEIGYAIAVKYWGQGICTKAVRIAVSQVFKDFPDLVRIQAIVNVDNKASQRVLEKAGFLSEGMLRKYAYHKRIVKDVAIFSLLAEDTRPPE